MKKLVLMAVAIVAVSFASCGNKAADAAKATADSIRIADSIDVYKRQLRGWWEEDYQQTQRYYNTILGHYGIAPTVATPERCV